MLAGYITYDELKLITGFTDVFLYKLICNGLTMHEADLEYNNVIGTATPSKYKQMMFNIQEVEEWLKAHIF